MIYCVLFILLDLFAGCTGNAIHDGFIQGPDALSERSIHSVIVSCSEHKTGKDTNVHESSLNSPVESNLFRA